MSREPMRIGFWHSEEEPKLPMPKARKAPGPNQALVLAALLYMEGKSLHKRHYKGFSRCRICKCSNGSTEYINNNFVWPEGLRHYIIEHNVQLDDEAEKALVRIAKRYGLLPAQPVKAEFVMIGTKFWDELLALSKKDLTKDPDSMFTYHRMRHLVKQAERRRKAP